MSFLSSAIEAQKRKRQDTSHTATKFQRRGQSHIQTSTTDASPQHNSTEPLLFNPLLQDTSIYFQSNTINEHYQNESTPNTPRPQPNSVSSSSQCENPSYVAQFDQKSTTLTNDPLSTETPSNQEQLSPNDTITPKSPEILESQKLQRLQQLEEIRALKYKPEPDKRTFENSYEFLLFSSKRYLWFWEQDLAQRSSLELDSFIGKQNLQDYNSTRKSLRPFFQHCKEKSLRRELLSALINVFEELSLKQYIKAQQAFYEVAIGNNPWPLGLPKVGIHERQAREKIDPSLIDHLLKDPIIQEYMQAIKRLMSYVEKRFPKV